MVDAIDGAMVCHRGRHGVRRTIMPALNTRHSRDVDGKKVADGHDNDFSV